MSQLVSVMDKAMFRQAAHMHFFVVSNFEQVLQSDFPHFCMRFQIRFAYTTRTDMLNSCGFLVEFFFLFH